MTQKSRPRSSRRSYRRRGIMAVARSSVFFVGRNQNASCPIRRRRRSATDMLSELGMRALAMSHAWTAVSPDPGELLAHERVELGPVSVRVDDRMLQTAAKRPGLGARVGRHGHSSVASVAA